jgi:multidrug efflux pump subunit AcrB
MLEVLKEKWLWILILASISVIVGSMIIVLCILLLPFPLNTIALVGIIILWGVVSGYKEWLIKEKERERKGQIA